MRCSSTSIFSAGSSRTVSNAIKYSDAEKQGRFVAIEAQAHESDYVIKVEDNGIGIPSDAVGKVFERFTRAHADLDDQLGVEGTGLGLSIVEECVKSLGGGIGVESEQGQGTIFRFTVPKKLPPIPAAS